MKTKFQDRRALEAYYPCAFPAGTLVMNTTDGSIGVVCGRSDNVLYLTSGYFGTRYDLVVSVPEGQVVEVCN